MAVSMAKLSSSSSCRPLVQGMMLLALLLLASIQAGPVMAQEQGLLEKGADVVKKVAGEVKKAVGGVEKAGGAGGTFPRTSPISEVLGNHVGASVETQGAVDEEAVEEFVDLWYGKLVGAVLKKFPSTGLNMLCKKRPDWKGFCNGAKMGIKVHKYLCKAQGSMDKQIDVRFLAIYMSVSFPDSFSYRGNSVFCWDPEVFWFPAAGTPVPSSSYP